MREWGRPDGSQFTPFSGIAVDVAGKVYVADTNNDRIQWYDASGNLLGQFGVRGTGNGQFRSPMGLALDSSSSILYVEELSNQRVQAFCLADETECRRRLDSDGDDVLDVTDNCPFEANAQQTDADLDLVGDGCDCDAADSSAWSAPSLARGLNFLGDGTRLEWTAPLDAGGLPELLSYDTLRSTDPSNFETTTVCVETDDGPNTMSLATQDPDDGGEVFFYVVRARSGCAEGGIGSTSVGLARTARGCP